MSFAIRGTKPKRDRRDVRPVGLSIARTACWARKVDSQRYTPGICRPWYFPQPSENIERCVHATALPTHPCLLFVDMEDDIAVFTSPCSRVAHKEKNASNHPGPGPGPPSQPSPARTTDAILELRRINPTSLDPVSCRTKPHTDPPQLPGSLSCAEECNPYGLRISSLFPRQIH